MFLFKDKLNLSEETINRILTILLIIAAAIFTVLLLDRLDIIPQQEMPHWIAVPWETGSTSQAENNAVKYEDGGVAEALQPPTSDASEKRRRAHFELVKRIAKVSSTITVSLDCTFTPRVAEVPNSGSIKVVNKSTTEYPMIFTQEFRLTIPANDSVTIQASEFPNGAGVYGYGCGREPAPSGLIHVPPTVAPTSTPAR